MITLLINIILVLSTPSHFVKIPSYINHISKIIEQRIEYKQNEQKLLKTHFKRIFTKKSIELPEWKKEIGNMICEKDWDCKTAKAVFYAESGFNCDAVSKTNDHGLTQLHGIKEYDCRKNLEIAYEMYKKRGWQPWSAYKNGKYRKYLNL